MVSGSHGTRRENKNVLVGLVGTLGAEAEILSLGIGQGGELDVAVVQVKARDLLIKDLGQDIDLLLECAALGILDVLLLESIVVVLEQHDLSKDLVGEAAGHDEGAVASSAAKVDKTTLGKEDDAAAGLHQEAVDLGLDVLDGLGIGLEPGNINLAIEMANVYSKWSASWNRVRGKERENEREGRTTYCKQ